MYYNMVCHGTLYFTYIYALFCVYIEIANVYIKKYIIFKHYWICIIFNLHENLWNEIIMLSCEVNMCIYDLINNDTSDSHYEYMASNDRIINT